MTRHTTATSTKSPLTRYVLFRFAGTATPRRSMVSHLVTRCRAYLQPGHERPLTPQDGLSKCRADRDRTASSSAGEPCLPDHVDFDRGSVGQFFDQLGDHGPKSGR